MVERSTGDKTIERLAKRFSKFREAEELGAASISPFDEAEAKKEQALDALNELSMGVPEGYRAVAHASSRNVYMRLERWVGLDDGLAPPIEWGPAVNGDLALWRLRTGRVRRFFVGQAIEGYSLDKDSVPYGWIYSNSNKVNESHFRVMLTPDITVEFLTVDEVQQRFVAPQPHPTTDRPR